jgi:CRP/FNR family transcriptional regulator, cyclic AMP receptor protein
MGRSKDRGTLVEMILSGRIEQYRKIFISVSTDILAEVPLFSNLDRRHLELVAGSLEDRKVEAGAMLARQGSSESEFMVILDGSARVERDGHVLAHLRGGDFCGEMSLIDGEPRSATIVTESPCVLLVMDGHAFRKLLDSVPGLETSILLTMCRRLRAADAELAALN